MNLHGLEFIAGELIAFTLGVIALFKVWEQHQEHAGDPEQHDDE